MMIWVGHCVLFGTGSKRKYREGCMLLAGGDGSGGGKGFV